MWALISQRHQEDEHGQYRDILETAYVSYLASQGIRVVHVSNAVEDVSTLFEDLPVEGVILSGGDEVDPDLYGGEEREGDRVSEDRDRIEFGLLDYAIENRVPLLGICRGIQTINVYFDGGIERDVSTRYDHEVSEPHPVELHHEGYAGAAGGQTIRVNSYHDQAVTADTLASGLRAFAVCGDIVEGLYHPDHLIAAVQWHPERPSPENEVNNALVEAFRRRDLFWGGEERHG